MTIAAAASSAVAKAIGGGIGESHPEYMYKSTDQHLSVKPESVHGVGGGGLWLSPYANRSISKRHRDYMREYGEGLYEIDAKNKRPRHIRKVSDHLDFSRF